MMDKDFFATTTARLRRIAVFSDCPGLSHNLACGDIDAPLATHNQGHKNDVRSGGGIRRGSLLFAIIGNMLKQLIMSGKDFYLGNSVFNYNFVSLT